MLGSSLWWSPLLMQYLTHSTSSSRFPLNFEPLHFSHRFSWSTVYSSASLSSLEPGMPSSSVRTVQDWSELLAIHVFFPITLTEFDFVCLSHGGGSKCRDVISAKRYCVQNTFCLGHVHSWTTVGVMSCPKEVVVMLLHDRALLWGIIMIAVKKCLRFEIFIFSFL